MDKDFTEWMPIWVWVIEHPEGIMVIDTGENSDVVNKDYFKSSGPLANWLNTTQFKFKVSREEEIDQQLLKIGIETKDVSKVLLTHLHLDHTDGIRHFRNNKIYVNKKEKEKPYGDLPRLYPEWFDPLAIELDENYQEFDKANFITDNKDLIIVQTAGHTYGHASYLLKTDQGYILFAGDVVYYQDQLVLNKFAGANIKNKETKNTYAKIKSFAKKNRLVILPSHDLKAGERLSKMESLYESNTDIE